MIAAEAGVNAALALAGQSRSDARRAAVVVANALHSASNAGIHNPHHSWLGSVVDDVEGVATAAVHQVAQFGAGVWDGVEQPLLMLAKLADPLTAPGEMLAVAKGLAYGVTHPLAFGRAMLVWKDLADGNVARWLGDLAPAVLAAVFTGGAGDVADGISGVTALDRAGATADDVAAIVASGDEKAAARIIMRGDDPVPGSIYADSPAQPGRDLSYPDSADVQIADATRNFTDGVYNTADPAPEMWLGNVHDSSRMLFGDTAPGAPGRSLSWGAKPTDLLGVSGTEDYVRKWALPPQWGGRDEITIMHVPAGSPGPVWDGSTAPQIVEKTGEVFPGGGYQVLQHTLSSDSAVWTGPLPWAKFPSVALGLQGGAKLAGGFTAARLPAGADPQR